MKSIRHYLLASFVFGIVLSVTAQVHSGDDSGTTPAVTVMVGRRTSFDVYTEQNKTRQLVCNEGGNVTYLVAENQCIDNQYLFDGKVIFVDKYLLIIMAPNFIQNAHLQ